MAFLYVAVALAVSYLIGSLSFAVIVSRVVGLSDPRSYGSGNPGATNVLRSGHRGAAIATLMLDALKGYAPVFAALWLSPQFGWGEGVPAFCGLAAFIGHLWPLLFGFRGGKGVATAAGVLMALNPWLGAATLVTWLIVAVFFRYASLAAIVSAVFAPFFELLYWGFDLKAVAIGVMSLLLIWRHEGNIRKLMAGTESRLGQKAALPLAAQAHHPSATKAAHSHGKRKGH